MDKEILTKYWSKLGKFRYPLLILLVGIVLMLWPTKEPETVMDTAEISVPQVVDALGDMEAQLEDLLSNAQGVGRVQVMLQYASSDKVIYQTDVSQELDAEENGTRSKTSESTALDGDSPIVVQTIYPAFTGAVVIADGGDNPTVRLNLVNAVSSLTGLGADAITVIKMKSN